MTAREEDKSMEGLLRRSLASEAPAPEVCPEPDALAAYAERSLAGDETKRWELHFSHCARCREQLAALQRAVEAEAGEEKAGAAGSRAGWGLGWNWLAPAGVLLAFALVWFIRDRVQTRTAGHTWTGPLVAMSKPETRPEGAPMSTATSALQPAASAELSRKTSADAREKAAERNGAIATDSARPASAGVARDKAESGVRAGVARDLAPSPTKIRAGNNPGVAGELKSEGSASGGVPKVAANEVELSRMREAPPAKPERAAKSPSGESETAGKISGTVEMGKLEAPASPPTAAPAPATAAARNGAAVATDELQAMPARQNGQTPESNAKQKKMAAQAEAVMVAGAPAAGAATYLMNSEGMPGNVVIKSPDPAVMWKIVAAGFVEHTVDGGGTWIGSQPSPGAELRAGAAPSAKVCWLAGSNGLILLTRDGKTWKKIAPPEPLDFVSITAKDASSATVTAANGRKFTTDDAGKKWRPAP